MHNEIIGYDRAQFLTITSPRGKHALEMNNMTRSIPFNKNISQGVASFGEELDESEKVGVRNAHNPTMGESALRWDLHGLSSENCWPRGMKLRAAH